MAADQDGAGARAKGLGGPDPGGTGAIAGAPGARRPAGAPARGNGAPRRAGSGDGAGGGGARRALAHAARSRGGLPLRSPGREPALPTGPAQGSGPSVFRRVPFDPRGHEPPRAPVPGRRHRPDLPNGLPGPGGRGAHPEPGPLEGGALRGLERPRGLARGPGSHLRPGHPGCPRHLGHGGQRLLPDSRGPLATRVARGRRERSGHGVRERQRGAPMPRPRRRPTR